MLRVVIPEPIPTKNRGEAAILGGIREALSLCGEYALTVYSPPSWISDDRAYSEEAYAVCSGIDLFDLENGFSETHIPRTRTHFFSTWGRLLLFAVMHRVSLGFSSRFCRDDLLKAIAKADMLVAGHDGLLCPNYFYLALAARIMKKPIAIYGGSHGMQGRKRWRYRKYFRFLANQTLLFTVRDPRAKEFFLDNNISPEQIHVFPDPAVLLKPCSDQRVRDILAAENVPHSSEVPLYGLIPVRGGVVFDNSFSAESDADVKHRQRVDLWADIVLHMLRTTDAHFVFLPHCTGPDTKNDDRRMNQDVFERLTEHHDRVTLIDSDYSARELKGIMKSCDFILGERTHGLIGAVSVATPCVALTVKEDLRMHYIMEVGFDRVTFDLNSPDPPEIKCLLSTEWNQRHETARAMQKKAVEIHAEATTAAELLRSRAAQVLGTNRLPDK